MALQIRGTPAYFINGVATSTAGNLSPQYLDMAIGIELGRSAGAPALIR